MSFRWRTSSKASRMHVLLNCFHMPTRQEGAAGAGSYLRAILPRLAEQVDLCVVTSRLNKPEYAFQGATTVAVESLAHPRFLGLLDKADVFYDPQNGLHPADLPSSLPVIVMVHDLQHNHYPHLFGKTRFNERNRDYGFAIARADGVVAISEWEKDNFLRYFGKREVRVIPHAAYLYEWYAKQDEPLSHWAVPHTRDYFLYPAVTWPHKNHYRLIEAFSLLNRHRDRPLKLVLTGTVEHAEAQSAWRAKLEESDQSKHVQILGYVSDAELAALMINTKGLVFPSLYEGFGIPIVDAMQFEKPVIASKLTCIPEVTSATIRFFRDPFDSLKMAQDIDAFDRDIQKNAVDTEPARQVALRYSVENTVNALIEFFEDTINRKRSSTSWSLVTDRDASAQVARERLTFIVDVGDSPGPGSRQHATLTDRILPRTGEAAQAEGSAFTFLCPYDAAEAFNALLEEHSELTGPSPPVCLYAREQPRSRALALRFALENVLKTDYFLYTSVEGFLSIDHGALKNAVVYLDLYDDCFSCILQGQDGGRPEIKRPKRELAQAVSSFQRVRNVPLAVFAGRVIRTETCRVDGMIGSIECATKDVTSYSSIVL